MIRKTLTILSLIGLLLSVGLWGASYLRVYILLGSKYSVGALNGLINVHRTPDRLSPLSVEEVLTLSGYSHISIGGVLHLGADGFHSFATAWRTPSGSFFIQRGLGQSFVVPAWMPTALFGVLFASCRPLHFHRRRKRKKLGLCVKCGYDLRASKDRCPECGTGFSK